MKTSTVHYLTTFLIVVCLFLSVGAFVQADEPTRDPRVQFVVDLHALQKSAEKVFPGAALVLSTLLIAVTHERDMEFGRHVRLYAQQMAIEIADEEKAAREKRE